jgi:hypothetical protein
MGMDSAECPICDGRIWFYEPAKLRQTILCKQCLTDLVVVSINPLDLDVLEEEHIQRLIAPRQRKKGGKNNRKNQRAKEFGDEDELEDILPKTRKKPKPGRERRRNEQI